MRKINSIFKDLIFVCFASSLVVSCTTIKSISSDASQDPIYATAKDLKSEARLDEIARNRAQLSEGKSYEMGKQSANNNGRYDYMPATSYAERFNRTGNGFFLTGNCNTGCGNSNMNNFNHNNFQGQRFSNPHFGMSFGNGFNPMFGNNINCNPWQSGYNDPWMQYQMMQNINSPFFTYNPYMFSFSLLNGYYDPWMMQYSSFNPYFYNPYFYNPNQFGNNNNPFFSTFNNVATTNPRERIIEQNTYNLGSTINYGNNKGNTTFERGNTNSSNTGTRGGFDANNRAQRSSGNNGGGGHQGSTKR